MFTRSLAAGLLGFLLAPVTVLCQQSSPADDLAAQVRARNAEAVLRSAEIPPSPRRAEVLQTRAGLLFQLMAVDPSKALDLTLPEELAGGLRGSAGADDVETAGEWTGTLTEVVADDFAGHRSTTSWILRTRDLVSSTPPGIVSQPIFSEA